MLDIAINHSEELKKKMNTIWFQDKYKYYNFNAYYSDFEISKDTWSEHQFVSLNSNNEVIVYIGYSINRTANYCHELGIINFSDDKLTFGRDLKQVVSDIFEKFNFQKFKFSVVIGNPIEKSYDKIIKKYGGCVVGIYANETKLMDGKYYAVKHYEILRQNYMITAHPDSYKQRIQKIYRCNKATLTPPHNFLQYNCSDDYKNSVIVDECLADEIKSLWERGIKTTGCCCGHGFSLGFIEVTDDCVEKMRQLGYVQYIYPNSCGGHTRQDAFIPKTYGHIYDGYSDGYLG